jgi:hypothetical protein
VARLTISPQALRAAGVGAKVCTAHVEQHGLAEEIGARPVEVATAGVEVDGHARHGYTVSGF